MSADSRTTILQALATFGEVHNRKVSSELTQIWITMFEDQDAEKLQRAFSEHLERSQYFPKPADINELIEGSAEARAIKGWDLVIEAMRKHGSYASVRFADPLIAPCVKAMGTWLQLCETPGTDLVWREKAFRERFLHYIDHPPSFDHVRYLAGSVELTNQGFDVEPDHEVIYLVGPSFEGTPPDTPALGQASPDEATTKAVRALATDKGAKGRGKGDQ